MADDRPVIEWTSEKLSRFKKAYKFAVDAKQETFTFEGHEIVVGYAKYLIEYLDDQFKTKKG